MTSNAVESVKDKIASMNAKTEKSQKASDTKQAKTIADTKEESDEPAKGQKATKSMKSMKSTKSMKSMKEPKSPKVTTENKTDEDGMDDDSKTVTSNEVLEDLKDSRLLDEISLPEEPHDIEEGSNLTKEKPKATVTTMIDIAREKAKEVIDASFHLFIAQAILFFQLRNCQINETGIEDYLKYGNTTIFDCDVESELSNMDQDFMIALGIATYSLIVGMTVVVHAMLMRDKGEPDIQSVFNFTDRIPIIDCLIEIPICLCKAPFVTLFLWAMDIACCVGLIFLVIAYRKASYEDGNTSAFILTAFLVKYDLYRLTGDIAQYYVINKAAIYEALMKKKEKIERLLGDKSKTPYDKVDEVVQDSEEGSC